MALIIEDGTLVANADSYVTAAEARAYALARGVTLSAVDSAVDILAMKAMDYIESKRKQFKGVLVASTQSLQWPRDTVVIDGFNVAKTTIPKYLKDAQCQAMVEASIQDLSPTGTGKEVIREKVDVIEVTYSQQGALAPQPILVKVENLLEPLYIQGLGSAALTSTRV